jgi:hypothetical protein
MVSHFGLVQMYDHFSGNYLQATGVRLCLSEAKTELRHAELAGNETQRRRSKWASLLIIAALALSRLLPAHQDVSLPDGAGDHRRNDRG